MSPWVKRLLIANVALFFAQMTLPYVTSLLIFRPVDVLVRPWTIYTIITYMFIHGSITHILFNMLALFFFGPRVEERLGSRHFVRLYFASGIAGALLSLVFTPSAAILGASGAVFGVQLAFAKYWPRERIYIWGVLPIEAWLLVLITTGLALYGGFSGGSGVAHFAHLGGYVGAWLYLLWMERRSPARQWKAKVEKPARKVEIGNWKNINTASIHEVNRAEVDRILDKISAQGIESLTPAERTFLSHFAPPDDRPVRPH